MDIYQRIETILQERKMSRRQLAAMAEIPPTTLQSALARKKNISMDMLKKIADALDVPIDELLGVEGPWWQQKGMQLQTSEIALSSFLGKLTPDETIELFVSLKVALECITVTADVEKDEQSVVLRRLHAIIRAYGEMSLYGHAMCEASEETPHDYLRFLQNYGECIRLINAHKDELTESALRWPGAKLRELINGGEPNA